MIRTVILPSVLLASTAAAQTAPQTVPGLDNYSLLSSQPTPAPPPAPTPVPSPAFTVQPVPTETPTPRAARRPKPTPRATSTPRTVPAPEPTVTPSPVASPYAPAPVAAATPLPRPAPPPEPPADNTGPWWPWAAGAAVLLALIGAWALRRRREKADVELVAAQVPDAPPRAEPVTDPVVDSLLRMAAPPATISEPREPAMLTRAPAPVARPWIELDAHPRRGGLNMISATVELEIAVRNTGDAAAEAVLIEAVLLPARSGQEAELGALFARPVARPAAPAFALAPGEERRVRVIAALALSAVEPLIARGRAMLVPVVALNAVYRWANGGAGQTAGAFVVGVEREGQAKLAPFWLDAPRMHDQLAARPHTLAVRR